MSGRSPVVRLSKRMSKALRHDPAGVGLELDGAGWVRVVDLVRALGVTRAEVDQVVAENDKQRFTVDGDRIRAAQGHSVPVDLGYAPAPPPAWLFHGTAPANLPAIRREGLLPAGRHHVHLSADVETAVRVGARRGGRPVVLRVDAAALAAEGAPFYRADNGVWLTGPVPPARLRVSRAA